MTFKTRSCIKNVLSEKLCELEFDIFIDFSLMCGEKKERFTSRFFCMTSIELENHVERTEDMAQNINLPIVPIL